MAEKFLEYANSFQAVSRLGLESPTVLLEVLGNPQKDLKFVHVAGTNGKGSVCNFLQSILLKAGYKTGKYTSPNMIDVCERICVDNEKISQNDMENLIAKVEKAAKETEKILGTMPTQFEIWTAAAFIYFKEKKCDIVVLETGLGGRLDATNVIDTPLLSVITRIDVDHTNYLGDTIEKITAEKCGIIKKGGKTITIKDNLLSVIREKCENEQNELVVTKEPKVLSPVGFNESFDYDDIENISLSLKGYNQIENATLAIESAKALKISEKFIKEGLLSAIHPGRFEIMSENPLIVYDGAHNKNGFTSLLNNIERYFDTKDITFVCAFMKDKDIDEVFSMLDTYKKTCEIITTTVLNNERAEDFNVLCEKFKKAGFNATSAQNAKEALNIAKNKNKELIVICGSLYLYKDLH